MTHGYHYDCPTKKPRARRTRAAPVYARIQDSYHKIPRLLYCQDCGRIFSDAAEVEEL